MNRALKESSAHLRANIQIKLLERRSVNYFNTMVVKIPVLVNRAKAAVSNEIIETPGTNTTEITPEKKNEIAAVAVEKKAATATNNITYHELIQRHFPRHQSKSNANDDSNVGDNSSISSRSSMNSMPNTPDRGEANPTTYVAALKAAAAASTRPSSEDAATVSSPSDHSREHIDHPYASPESLQLDDVSVAYCTMALYVLYTLLVFTHTITLSISQ
jgi:hypothetical protein